MKKLMLFWVLAALLLCSCSTNGQASVSSQQSEVDGCYTSSCTMSSVYDKDYDSDIVGVFALSDYTDHINSQKEILEKVKETISNEVRNVYTKSYGNFKSADFVKYAAIEAFDQLNLGKFSPADIKIYKDESTGSWMATNKSLEDLKMQQHNILKLDGSFAAIFSGEGKLLYCGTN